MRGEFSQAEYQEAFDAIIDVITLSVANVIINNREIFENVSLLELLQGIETALNNDKISIRAILKQLMNTSQQERRKKTRELLEEF